MDRLAQIAGISMAEVIASEFGASAGTGGPPGVRVAGLHVEEIPHLVTRLRECTLQHAGAAEPVAIVVGSRGPVAGVPSELTLQPDWTLTRHRHGHPGGVVLIELDPQGDETGIRSMYAIGDADLLNREERLSHRLRKITEVAWRVVDPECPVTPPESLLDAMEQVFRQFARHRKPPLRSWLAYCAAVAEKLTRPRRAPAGHEVDAAVADSLPHLNLFSDRELFETRNAVGRRLERNYFMSELRSPQGTSVPDEFIGERIDAVELLGEDGTPLAAEPAGALRGRMRKILASGGPDAANHVDLRTWEQLFETRSAAVGLGTLIRTDLEQHHAPRITEFETLEVQDRLDDGDPEAAQTLIDAPPPPEAQPLVDCLPATLRKKLDRLAFEGERGDLTDPLVAILYGLAIMEPPEGGGDAPEVRLEWDKASHGATKSSCLFAFLYRNALRDIAESCDGKVGSRFTLDPAVEVVEGIDGLFAARPERADDEDAEERAEQEWGPLRFKLTVSESRTPLLRFRWDPREVPGLAAFAWLIGRGGAQTQLAIPKLEEWFARSFESVWDRPDSPAPPGGDEILQGWHNLAHASFREWMRAGLSIEAIDSFMDAWAPLLQRAAETYVPRGGVLASLNDLLDRDTARTADGRFVMLATHPLRLRWLRHHIHNLSKAIADALLGQLRLNPENDRLYFHWIRRVSPHRQPPVLSAEGKLLATAVRESNLHEEFTVAPTGTDRRREWLGALDDLSIDELVAMTRRFVEAFPWKSGGLCVLLLATSGAATVARKFVERLRTRDLTDLHLEMHVATASAEHDSVAKALAGLDSEEGRRQALFPSFQLVLHSWEGGDLGQLKKLRGRVDVALAPNLFGLHSVVLEETRRASGSAGGRFDPWLDAATHFRPSDGRTINVSQVLLPTAPDPMLENWSTLTVRRRRQSPVDTGDPSGTDFITLQVAFEQHEVLFLRLHDVAHWVVTLDPFVGRDQIDALRNAPDVIVVKPGVGKNESNTLVVSSAAGKEWVTRQLAKRLVSDFGFQAPRSESVARRLYEIGRNVAPGLMLRALGLGRTTEEVLGIVLARYALDRFRTADRSTNGVEYWICLDEYPDWFGGAQGTRPDMLRVRLTRSQTRTFLALDVLESKFRRQVDAQSEATAREQVTRGQRLFDGVFAAVDRPSEDAGFWRREILTAVSQCPRRASRAANLPARRCYGAAPDEDAMLDDLRAGNVEFNGTCGVVSLTSWDGPDEPPSPSTADPGGMDVLRIGRRTVLELLARIERELAPDEDEGPQVIGADGGGPGASPSGSGGGQAVRRADPQGCETSPTGAAVPSAARAVPSSNVQPVKNVRGSGVSSDELERRYGKLLDRMAQLKVDVARPEAEAWQQGPGFCLYRVVPRPGVPAERITGRVDDIRLALELPAGLCVRTYLDRGAVVFEVPKEEEDRYFVTAESVWARTVDDHDALRVAFAEDIRGDLVDIDFSSSDTPHLLIAGQTGSGKSVALETILLGLCKHKSPEQLRLLLIDPKGTELVGLEDDPHTEGDIGWQAEDALRSLHIGIEEMERRYKTFRAAGVRSLQEYNRGVAAADQLPWWLLVLDEYADLTSDPDDRRSIEQALKRIAQKGRASGIHLIVATQKPSAEVISTVIRSNLPAQLALRVKSATDSRIILEEAGAESLAGKGDAFLRTARGLRRVQCARVTQAVDGERSRPSQAAP